MTSFRSALDIAVGDAVECGFGGRGALQQDIGHRHGKMHPWPRVHQLRGQLLDDAEKGCHARLVDRSDRPVLLDEVDRPGGLPRGQRVIDGVTEVAVIGEPVRGGAVQVFEASGIIALESAPQKSGEHLVVAKPLRVVIDAPQEQAASLDILEYVLPAADPGQHRCELPAGPFGDRGRPKEVKQFGL